VLDTYEPERAPVGRMVLRFTDRAFTIATSTNPLVRYARTRIAPALIPVALKPRVGRAYAFRTVSQLAIRYRGSPLSHDGRHSRRHGPRAGDRLPDAILSTMTSSSLHRCLVARLASALCPTGGWPPTSPRHRRRYAGVVTVHHVSATNGPGVLHDPDDARTSPGVSPRAAQYLCAPDGHRLMIR
jgi:hypothetical protein